jgi:hypothetical protein
MEAMPNLREAVTCRRCSHEFRTERLMIYHEQRAHEIRGVFRCSQCGRQLVIHPGSIYNPIMCECGWGTHPGSPEYGVGSSMLEAQLAPWRRPPVEPGRFFEWGCAATWCLPRLRNEPLHCQDCAANERADPQAEEVLEQIRTAALSQDISLTDALLRVLERLESWPAHWILDRLMEIRPDVEQFGADAFAYLNQASERLRETWTPETGETRSEHIWRLAETYQMVAGLTADQGGPTANLRPGRREIDRAIDGDSSSSSESSRESSQRPEPAVTIQTVRVFRCRGCGGRLETERAIFPWIRRIRCGICGHHNWRLWG